MTTVGDEVDVIDRHTGLQVLDQTVAGALHMPLATLLISRQQASAMYILGACDS